MPAIEEMQKKHPDALCFQGCVCPHIDPTYFAKGGACINWPTKWPRTFCRMGFAVDRRIKPELKE